MQQRTTSAIAAAVALVSVSGPAHPRDTRLYWGDTHVHSSWSVDAYAVANYFTGPDEAYAYAKGQPVLHTRLRNKVRLTRPLDFLVVADHAERFRWQINLIDAIPPLRDLPGFDDALALVNERPRESMAPPEQQGLDPRFVQAATSDVVRHYGWKLQIDAAERHYEPGVFTTFAGWEWTRNVGGNQHRVVFTPDGPAITQQFVPFSSDDGENPEDLWAFLDRTSAGTGAKFIVIPHNSNLSVGRMFALTGSDGRPVDAAYSHTRARWERVMEITQVKGTSEVHPAFSPNDEFAGFELHGDLLIGGQAVPMQGDYARTALLRGIAFDRALGVNPFQVGFIGSSDTHTGLASVDESDFLGKTVRDALPQERLETKQDEVYFHAWEMSASGLAAAWAEENDRESIAAAFARREVYGTSGPRFVLRVFGGFGFEAADADDIVAAGYAKGVPMGGELRGAPRNARPSLLIYAAKDPEGANLDRVQVVKGWIDERGEPREQVFDAAWSGDRAPDASGRLPPVGDTVDRSTARYRNSIGAAELLTLWTDPSFDAGRPAFYYVRVLEIPTPRHSLYDAVALGVDVAATRQPAVIQERAWSSPIWYRITGSDQDKQDK